MNSRDVVGVDGGVDGVVDRVVIGVAVVDNVVGCVGSVGTPVFTFGGFGVAVQVGIKLSINSHAWVT